MAEPVFERRAEGGAPDFTIALTAEERRRVRFRRELPDGRSFGVALPRGAVLEPGALLMDRDGTQRLLIQAADEQLVHVTAASAHDLVKLAYHLGNRHVALEVGPDYLRLLPDPVLEGLIRTLGADCREVTGPFHPEAGAYGHAH
jgi:urease accessory protein